MHTSPDYFERMLKERPGNVVVLSGRNGVKMDRILASVKAGLHVLADKPWILKSADLPKVEAALAEADARKLVAYDIMTERFEVTTMLQRALVNDRATFGEIVPGSEAEPSVYMESVHHLMKVVAGAPNIRPPWFFDTNEQGEAASDIGTHLVDLVQWTLFPDRAIDYRADIRVLAAQRWPTWIPEADFRRVTNAPGFPERSRAARQGRTARVLLQHARARTRSRNIHTKLNIIWDWEAPAGAGDTHFAFYKGTRARIEVRQTKADRYLSGAVCRPGRARRRRRKCWRRCRRRSRRVQAEYPGVGVEDRGAEIKITVPDALRVGHEAHFAQVASSFLKYVRDRSALPAWERPNMLAKYYVTTAGAELSRKSAQAGAAHRAEVGRGAAAREKVLSHERRRWCSCRGSALKMLIDADCVDACAR